MTEQTRDTLKAAEAETLDSYRAFADQTAPEDARGFAAHHAACKAALAHLEALLRLVRILDKDSSSASPDLGVRDQLAAARAAAGLDQQDEKTD